MGRLLFFLCVQIWQENVFGERLRVCYFAASRRARPGQSRCLTENLERLPLIGLGDSGWRLLRCEVICRRPRIAEGKLGP